MTGTYGSIGDTVVIGIIVTSISDAIAISVLLSGVGRVDAVILHKFYTNGKVFKSILTWLFFFFSFQFGKTLRHLSSVQDKS